MTKTDEMRPWMDGLWRAANRDLQRWSTAQYRRAINRGELIPPDTCEDCGRTERPLHGHHEDYAQPLDVAWVCAMCHSVRHRARWWFLERSKENVLQ